MLAGTQIPPAEIGEGHSRASSEGFWVSSSADGDPSPPRAEGATMPDCFPVSRLVLSSLPAAGAFLADAPTLQLEENSAAIEGGLSVSLPTPVDLDGSQPVGGRDGEYVGSTSPDSGSGNGYALSPHGNEDVEPDVEHPTTIPTILIRAARWVESNGRFTPPPADITDEERGIMAGARAALRLRRSAAGPRARGRGTPRRTVSDVPRGGRGSSTADHAAEQSSFVAGLVPRSPEEAGSADHLLWMQLEGHLEPIPAGRVRRPAAKSGGPASSSSSVPVMASLDRCDEVEVTPVSRLYDEC